MKTLTTTNFKKSLAGLKAHKWTYFEKHPTEPWREVKLITPDKKSWAIVKIKNPSLSPSELPTALRHPSPVREGEDTEPNR